MILSPWCISATLIGPSNSRDRGVRGGHWSTERPNGRAMWRLWTLFYPSLNKGGADVDTDMDDGDLDTDRPWMETDDLMATSESPSKKTRRSATLGRMVEVDVCGHRMHWPSTLVCVLRSDDRTLTRTTSTVPSTTADVDRVHAERVVAGLLQMQRSIEANLNPQPAAQPKSMLGVPKLLKWHLSDCTDHARCSCAGTSATAANTMVRRRRISRTSKMHTRRHTVVATVSTAVTKTMPAIDPRTAPPTLEQQAPSTSHHQMISPAIADVKPDMKPESSTMPNPGKRKIEQISKIDDKITVGRMTKRIIPGGQLGMLGRQTSVARPSFTKPVPIKIEKAVPTVRAPRRRDRPVNTCFVRNTLDRLPNKDTYWQNQPALRRKDSTRPSAMSSSSFPVPDLDVRPDDGAHHQFTFQEPEISTEDMLLSPLSALLEQPTSFPTTTPIDLPTSTPMDTTTNDQSGMYNENPTSVPEEAHFMSPPGSNEASSAEQARREFLEIWAMISLFVQMQ